MNRQIRRGVYETNSSSCHAIAISKTPINTNKLPDHVTFTHGEFGWESEEYHDTWSKAAYLYEAIYSCFEDDNNVQEKLDHIIEVLGSYGITCEFEPNERNEYGYCNGYIDHGYETIDFVNEVLEDDNKLLTYLFGNSFIITGNDNDDGYSDRMYYEDSKGYGELKSEFDDYEVFEKGN